jgi:hypothetical protein
MANYYHAQGVYFIQKKLKTSSYYKNGPYKAKDILRRDLKDCLRERVCKEITQTIREIIELAHLLTL